MPDPEGYIHTFADHVDHAIKQQEAHLHRRKSVEESIDQRPHVSDGQKTAAPSR